MVAFLPSASRTFTKGFTLIEVLIVLAMIGILMVFGISSYVRGLRSAELREAAVQVATDLKRAKAITQRQSQDVALEFPTATATTEGKKTYSVKIGAAPAQVRVLDKGVTIGCRATGGNCGSGATTVVKYQAPYGELEAIGSILELRSPMTSITPLEVRVVGVTGKVIVTQGTP